MGTTFSSGSPGPHRDKDSWRQWVVPGILAVFVLGFARLRSPCGAACGPRPSTRLAARQPGVQTEGHAETVLRIAGHALSDGTPRAGTAVLYLHGTIRCKECLDIEHIAEDTVHSSFTEPLIAGTLSWQSIDYDLPENEQYARAFELPFPSLVLAAVSADGQVGRYRILERTWDLLRQGPDALDAYVRQELHRFVAETTPSKG